MLRKIFVVLLLLILPAPLLAAEVRVDYNRYIDFAKYRTFDIEVGPLIRGDGVADERNTLAENRLRQAIALELRARGLEEAAGEADLVVHVSGRNSERTAIVSSGFGPYWGYGYRRFGYWGRYGYWNPYGYWATPFRDDVWTRRYLEGSLIVDVVERDTDRLVYRAHVIDEVGKNLDKQVANAIDKAFKKFPVKELAK
jgi:hypothetical protein